MEDKIYNDKVLTPEEYMKKKELKRKSNQNYCYCNSERIVACAFIYGSRCPRICRLFSNNEGLESEVGSSK